MNIKLNKAFSSIELKEVNKRFLYNGFTAWPKLKNHIFIDLLPGNEAKGPSVKDNFSFQGIYLILLSCINICKLLLNRKSRILYHGAQSTLGDDAGSLEDSHFPLYLDRQETISILNSSNSKSLFKLRRLVRLEKLIIDNYILWIIRFILSPLFKGPLEEDIIWLQNQLSIHSIVLSRRRIIFLYKSFCINQYFWYLFLKFTKIRKAYVISCYSKSDFVAACRRLHIYVHEIQHGVVGDEHRGYNYVCSKENLPVPNCVEVYNNFWLSKLASAGFYSENSIKVSPNGFPKFHSHNIDYPSKFILFTGQGLYFNEVKEFSLALNSWLKRTGNVLLYKPHPRESMNETGLLNDVDSLVVYTGRNSAEVLIEKCQSHISFYSTCHYTAVDKIGRTYVLGSPNVSLMMSSIEREPNKFCLVHNAEEFINAQSST